MAYEQGIESGISALAGAAHHALESRAAAAAAKERMVKILAIGGGALGLGGLGVANLAMQTPEERAQNTERAMAIGRTGLGVAAGAGAGLAGLALARNGITSAGNAIAAARAVRPSKTLIDKAVRILAGKSRSYNKGDMVGALEGLQGPGGQLAALTGAIGGGIGMHQYGQNTGLYNEKEAGLKDSAIAKAKSILDAASGLGSKAGAGAKDLAGKAVKGPSEFAEGAARGYKNSNSFHGQLGLGHSPYSAGLSAGQFTGNNKAAVFGGAGGAAALGAAGVAAHMIAKNRAAVKEVAKATLRKKILIGVGAGVGAGALAGGAAAMHKNAGLKDSVIAKAKSVLDAASGLGSKAKSGADNAINSTKDFANTTTRNAGDFTDGARVGYMNPKATLTGSTPAGSHGINAGQFVGNNKGAVFGAAALGAAGVAAHMIAKNHAAAKEVAKAALRQKIMIGAGAGAGAAALGTAAYMNR